jgi:cell division protein FtsI (penicillin-binding protein 3)
MSQTTQSQKKNLREKNKPDLQRIIASSTSSVVRELLSGVVERGTARKVKIPGYKLGGKTGTADKPNPELGGYYSDRVIASFVAIFPVDDPEYAMLVMLDEPSIDINGTVTRTASATAVPVARSILMRIMPLLNIIPNNQP